ncbi:hypothetical protein E2C01_091226 [Portunus trituberculatus]|uniref:Uncharacterized protein n=1 Tax=Portunus trituberculatus TaxID=210409 RepID=A0A5B7JNG4_PORTR|nr:hypothetical protein [Portunus trituberculatus]
MRRGMTLGQSSPQLRGREGDIIRLPSSGRKIYANRFHSLAVTCAQGCRMPPGNTSKVLRDELGDIPRVSHRSPSRQQNLWGRRRILPSNSADFVKNIRKRSADRLFVPHSKFGGLELGSAEKRPDTTGPHDVAGDERKLPVSISQRLCMLRSTKERDA